MSENAHLVIGQNLVEIPFIIVQIGDYTLGHCSSTYKNKMQTTYNITYPNYMQSLNITKINGAINTYVLTMVYAITEQDDPNRLEKIFSSVSDTRKVTFKYGDWGAPSYIFKEEEAIITKLTTKVDVKASTITYTVNCTSTAVSLTAGSFSFPAVKDKGSNVLKGLLNNNRYGLSNVFTGMTNSGSSINNFIPGNDKPVQLEAKPSTGILDYVNYVVDCMTPASDKGGKLKDSCYTWATFDDTSNKYGGTYFKVVELSPGMKTDVTFDTYVVNVGYPSEECVMDFQVNNDDSWSLLYEYGGKIDLPEYSYSIDNKGNMVKEATGIITPSRITHATTETSKNWWTMVTKFPITATLTLKGLLRPSMLMSYVKVNAYFYGRKHNSSGLYIITKQQDSISGSGYRTTLNLTRIGEDM